MLVSLSVRSLEEIGTGPPACRELRGDGRGRHTKLLGQERLWYVLRRVWERRRLSFPRETLESIVVFLSPWAHSWTTRLLEEPLSEGSLWPEILGTVSRVFRLSSSPTNTHPRSQIKRAFLGRWTVYGNPGSLHIAQNCPPTIVPESGVLTRRQSLSSVPLPSISATYLPPISSAPLSPHQTASFSPCPPFKSLSQERKCCWLLHTRV